MIELKTLKDLNHLRVSNTRSIGKTTFDVNVEVLKEEAIKWIKTFEEEQKYNYEPRVNIPKEHEIFFDDEHYSFYNVIEWIKHFFNITEEDLK